MLVPAVVYKDEIEKRAHLLRYSEEMMFYNGTQEHGCINIITDHSEGRYQWAIVDDSAEGDKRLIGYICYSIDYFSSVAYAFGLIAFEDNPQVMTQGILQAIHHLNSMNLHKIEWRCVSDNPARGRYLKIVNTFGGNDLRLTDVFKDEKGVYHDVDIFEIFPNRNKKVDKPEVKLYYCRDCKYWNGRETPMGRECTNANRKAYKQWSSNTSNIKVGSNQACKSGFELKESMDD